MKSIARLGGFLVSLIAVSSLLAAPAVDGRANEALVEFLADYFGVAKRSVRIVAGLRSRQKRVIIDGAVWRRPGTA